MLTQKSKQKLTLLEELEKLEQQITLTLQEIDHNFNKTHRIVSNSILPVVERYQRESQAVWAGAKFWKQFFETSANVKLDNYYEDTTLTTDFSTTVEDENSTVNQSGATTQTAHDNDQNRQGGEYDDEYYDQLDRTFHSTLGDETQATLRQTKLSPKKKLPGRDIHTDGEEEEDEEDLGDDSLGDISNDSLLASLNLEQSTTPKASKRQRPTHRAANMKWANIDSPYEALTKELRNSRAAAPTSRREESPSETPPSLPSYLASTGANRTQNTISTLPTTPRPRNQRAANYRLDEDDSPIFLGAAGVQSTAKRVQFSSKLDRKDPHMHRMLDKNYRIQATPLGKPTPSRYGGTIRSAMKIPGTARSLFPTAKRATGGGFNSTDSSPSLPSPHLETQFLDYHQTHKHKSRDPPISGPKFSAKSSRSDNNPVPKTPMRTPGMQRRRQYNTAAANSDSDSDLDFGPEFSPPVTIQFSLPQRTILATPAREASKRIVADILKTAGADGNESSEFSLERAGRELEEGEYSPTVVRARGVAEEDSF